MKVWVEIILLNLSQSRMKEEEKVRQVALVLRTCVTTNYLAYIVSNILLYNCCARSRLFSAVLFVYFFLCFGSSSVFFNGIFRNIISIDWEPRKATKKRKREDRRKFVKVDGSRCVFFSVCIDPCATNANQKYHFLTIAIITKLICWIKISRLQATSRLWHACHSLKMYLSPFKSV